jgi:hypothetical protein
MMATKPSAHCPKEGLIPPPYNPIIYFIYSLLHFTEQAALEVMSYYMPLLQILTKSLTTLTEIFCDFENPKNS